MILFLIFAQIYHNYILYFLYIEIVYDKLTRRIFDNFMRVQLLVKLSRTLK